MKTFLSIIVFCIFFTTSIFAATINVTTSKNWSAAGISSGDAVNIYSGATLTVDGNYSCASISIGNATTNGTLAFNTGSQLTVSGNLTFNNATVGTIDMTNGGTFIFSNFAANSYTTPVLIPGTGTMQINSSTARITPASASFRDFNDLIIAGSTTISLYATSGPYNYTFNTLTINSGAFTTGANNLTVYGDASIAGGTLNLSGNTTKTFSGNINLSSGTFSNSALTTAPTVAGNFVVSGGTYSGTGLLSVSGNFNSTSGTTTMSNTGALSVTGTTQIDGTVNWTGTGAKSFTGDITNTGTWSSTAATTFNIAGSITNTGTFTATNGTYNLTGSSKTINGTVTLFTTAISGSYTNNNTLTIGGNLTGAGSLTQATSATLTLNGATNSITTLTATATSNTVTYGGGATQTANTTNYYNLEVNKTGGTATLGGAINVANNLTVTAGTTSITGTISITNNLSVAAGTTTLTGSTVTVGNNLAVNGGTLATYTGALTVTGTTNTSVGASITFANATGAKTFTGDITNAGTWNSSANATINIAGSITNTGTFTATNGTYNLTGSSKTINGTVTLFTTAISGSYTNNNTLTIGGNLTGAGSLTQATSATLTLNGATNSITTLTATATSNTVTYGGGATQTANVGNYYNLIVNKTGRTATLGGAINVANNLTVTAGTTSITGTISITNNLSVAAGTTTLTGSTVTVGNNLAVNGGTLATNTGALTVTGTTTTSLGASITFANATGAKTFTGDITNAGTWNSSANATINIAGSITNTGTFTATNGTYNLTGSSKTINGTVTLFTTAISGSYTNNNTLTIGGNLTGAGSLTQATSATLTLNGATNSITTLTATATSNTVTYNRTTTQTVKATTYYNLTVSGARNANSVTIPDGITIKSTYTDDAVFTTGGYTVAGATTTFDGTTSITGSGTKTTFNNLTISSGTLAGKSDSMYVRGNFTNNGTTYNHNNGKIIFNAATGTQTISGAGTTNFYNITINHATSGGAQITTGTYNLYGSLEMLNNATTINVGSSLLTLKSTGLANNQSGRIGDLTGKTLTGSVKWERYVAGNTTWRQIGTPISGQALSNWYDPTNFPMSGHFPGSDYAGGFTSAYYYDEAKASLYSDFDSGYVEPTNITNSISPDAINGKGWAIYLGQTADMAAMNPFTVKMTGNPITGNQPYILTNGGNIGEGYATSETGYHLLANPYPSQIDISASGWSNIDGYYSLDPNTGNYDFYDLNSFTGSGTATGIVAQGQAILLYTATNNNTITFTENMKTSAGGSESFLRQAATPTFAYNSLDIKISSNETTFSDRTKIMFNPNGDKNFVSKTGDAKKVNSPERRAPRISTLTGDGVSLLHNEYAGFNQPFVIPVEVSCPQAGKYTISGNGIETNGSQLVLVDKLLKKETNLTTDFTYQFNADKKEAFTNRFQIVNRTNVRTINENTPNAQLRVSNLANQLTVDVFTDELEAGKLSVTSISGQVVYELNGVMPTQSQTITNQGWAPGIYVVKFEGEKNSLVKKVVIQ